MSTVNTPLFRVSYPNVFEAKINDLSKQMEYSLEAIFAPDADLSQLRAAAQKALVAKFGADKATWPKNIRSPFKSQSTKAKNINGKQVIPEPYTEEGVFLNLRNKQRPSVVDGNLQSIIDPNDFYAGCYAIASVSVYAYDKGGNCGVNFSLSNIQKVKDGDPLGGRTRPEDDFVAVESTGTKSATSTDIFI